MSGSKGSNGDLLQKHSCRRTLWLPELSVFQCPLTLWQATVDLSAGDSLDSAGKSEALASVGPILLSAGFWHK